MISNKKEVLTIKEFFDQFLEKGIFSPQSIFWIVVLAFILLSIIGIVCFFIFYVSSNGVSNKLAGNNFKRADTLGYIVTYIVPLMSMDISSFRSLLLNFLLFFIIGIFYIKNNQFFMNPILNLCGYNVLESDAGTIYITKLSPRKIKEKSQEGEKVILVNIVEDIYLVK